VKEFSVLFITKTKIAVSCDKATACNHSKKLEKNYQQKSNITYNFKTLVKTARNSTHTHTHPKEELLFTKNSSKIPKKYTN
jgi:hypothetical protein